MKIENYELIITIFPNLAFRLSAKVGSSGKKIKYGKNRKTN